MSNRSYDGWTNNVQLLAADAVVHPNEDAWFRYVCRWYSREFHTPLHDVYDLPMDFVIQNYFEGAIEKLDEDARAEYLEELLLTPEERQSRVKVEEKMEKLDDEVFEKLNAEVKAGSLKGPPKERKKLNFRKDAKAEALRQFGNAKVTDAAAPKMPDFSVNFGSNLLEEVGDLDPLGPSPKKKVI